MLAKIVIDRVPSIEMVRFVNSGTEACLSVLRLMRAYTKRDKVLLPSSRHITAMIRVEATEGCASPWVKSRWLSTPYWWCARVHPTLLEIHCSMAFGLC